MRRPTKASSAGSTSGQASRLGSFFGAFAVRDGSLRVDGSGASSIGWVRSGLRARLVLAALLATTTYLLLAAGPTTPPASAQACPNAELRQQNNSTHLPDCRAYELVSPENSNGLQPGGAFFGATGAGSDFDTWLVAPTGPRAGDSVVYTTDPALPDTGGSATLTSYEAVRNAGGWVTQRIGPSGEQAVFPVPGGVSPDHDYSFVVITESTRPFNGTLAIEGAEPSYLRTPDGSFELAGRGSLGDDPRASAKWITPGASHVIFRSGAQLEPDAPLAGTEAVYDRTPGGPTHVVSLLPGDITPSVDQGSFFRGASADGSAVVFSNGGDFPGNKLYVRLDNTTTYQVTAAASTFAGVSDDGRYLFYANAETNQANPQTPADLFSYDTTDQSTTQITHTGDAQFTNVSPDGSRVYFVSPSQIAGQGTAGQPNLYVWERATDTITFIRTVDPADLTGDKNLVRWTFAAGDRAGPGRITSRTTPDGTVLVFESHANLTAYDAQGHSQIYRYDTADASLVCVSCNPSGAPATSPARLQSVAFVDPESSLSTNEYSVIPNVTADGGTVFFEATDPLVAGDTNTATDVYQWKAGQLSLISSGRSPYPNHLYAMTPDGHDVFFTANEALVPHDLNGGGQVIYDARIGGGFPRPVPDPVCVGDDCQGAPSGAPALPPAASSIFFGPGNAFAPAKVRVSKTTVKGSSIVLSVKAPAQGRITVTGSGLRSVKRSVGKAGTYTLKIGLTKRAKQSLKRHKKLRLKVRVGFAPNSGQSSATIISLTVKQSRQAHKSRAATYDRGGSK